MKIVFIQFKWLLFETVEVEIYRMDYNSNKSAYKSNFTIP